MKRFSLFLLLCLISAQGSADVRHFAGSFRALHTHSKCREKEITFELRGEPCNGLVAYASKDGVISRATRKYGSPHVELCRVNVAEEKMIDEMLLGERFFVTYEKVIATENIITRRHRLAVNSGIDNQIDERLFVTKYVLSTDKRSLSETVIHDGKLNRECKFERMADVPVTSMKGDATHVEGK